MGVEVEAEAGLLTRSLQPHLVHTKSRAFLRHARPLLPLAMPSPAYKRRRVVAPHLITWTHPKTHRCSLQTRGKHPAGKPKRPWMKSQSGCANASASASQVGAGIGNASRSDGLVTGPLPLHASLVIAKDIRSETVSETVIVIVKGTVLGRRNETGIGLLDVVVDMAVRVVPAAEADTVEVTVTATATGRWPREWDSNVFAHMGPSITLGQTYMNSQPFMDQSQYSVSGTDPLILTKHTIVALADSSFFLFDLPIPGYCSLY